ncbi:hypothetical protein FOZ62_030367 [Perkinsus olseni]|uniref:Uncharacterized protein n=1 Tax=Perkinsus olseni TaxID=32597 RepID=A0A7J6RF89_PEROL|nr:hypothetical protein FOZ62_030367 [Perkinsus olseni]
MSTKQVIIIATAAAAALVPLASAGEFPPLKSVSLRRKGNVAMCYYREKDFDVNNRAAFVLSVGLKDNLRTMHINCPSDGKQKPFETLFSFDPNVVQQYHRNFPHPNWENIFYFHDPPSYGAGADPLTRMSNSPFHDSVVKLDKAAKEIDYTPIRASAEVVLEGDLKGKLGDAGEKTLEAGRNVCGAVMEVLKSKYDLKQLCNEVRDASDGAIAAGASLGGPADERWAKIGDSGVDVTQLEHYRLDALQTARHLRTSVTHMAAAASTVEANYTTFSFVPSTATHQQCETAVGQLESGTLPTTSNESLHPYDATAHTAEQNELDVLEAQDSRCSEPHSDNAEAVESHRSVGIGVGGVLLAAAAVVAAKGPEFVPSSASTAGPLRPGGLKTTIAYPEALVNEQSYPAMGVGCCCPSCQSKKQELQDQLRQGGDETSIHPDLELEMYRQSQQMMYVTQLTNILAQRVVEFKKERRARRASKATAASQQRESCPPEESSIPHKSAPGRR